MTQTDIQTAHQALRKRAQAIFKALQAVETPTTYADIIRAARAIMTVSKMLKQLWPEDMEDEAVDPAEHDTRAVPPQLLNRQQRRAAAARQKNGLSKALKALAGDDPNQHIPQPA